MSLLVAEHSLYVAMWHRRNTPPICERLIGFSVPKDDRILVVSYEGVHIIHLGPQIRIDTDNTFKEYDIYNPDSSFAQYDGQLYSVLGLHGGHPLHESPQEESLFVDTESKRLSVLRNGETVYTTKYENFSGDWVAATFSPDGDFIVLGCPYDFDFIILERTQFTEKLT